MTTPADELAQRFAARQVELTAAELARDAERLAVAARQYADELGTGVFGGARRLSQEAAALALTERQLAGMRAIADLFVPEAQQ